MPVTNSNYNPYAAQIGVNTPYGSTNSIELAGGTLSKQAVQDFMASNPSQQQIMQRASDLGMTYNNLRDSLNMGGYLVDGNNQSLMNGQGGKGGLYNDLLAHSGDLGFHAGDSYGGAGANGDFGNRTIQGGGQSDPWGGGGGTSNLAFGGGSSGAGSSSTQGSMQSSTQAGGQNPYLADMGKNMVSQMQENYTRNQAPLARSGAMAAGGFGGSRQGVVEANGLNDLNRGIGQNLTNLYGQDWTNGQNRNLQQQSINNSYDLGSRSLNNQYDLGLRSSDLGFANLDANIANSNFSNQLNAANFGLNATNAMNGQTGAAIQAGTNVQRTPMDYHNYFTNAANNAGGLGGNTTGSQTNASNPYASMAGGAMMGYDLYKQWNQPQQNLGMGNSDRSALYGNMGYTGQP